MRTVCWLSLPWWLLAFCCTCARRGAPPETLEAFQPLLDRLPPQADVLAIADLAEAGRTFRGLLDRFEKTPAVAENPPLRAAFQQARAELDGRLAQIKEQSGIDVLADLERAALAIRFSSDAEPDFTLAVRGKFPKGSLGKILPAAARRLEPGREAFQLEDETFLELTADGILVLSSTERPAGSVDKDAAKRLLDTHPRLLTSPAPEMLLRLSFVMPKWLKETLPADAPMRWLAEVERAVLTLGPGLAFDVEAGSARVAENLRLLAEGFKELAIGGRNLWRAYILFGLGLDFGQILQMPPDFRSVFENRKAILATMEEFLGEPAGQSEVRVEGRRVSLQVGPRALMGSTFTLGILAAIAIPAFINYVHRADRERVEEMVDRFDADKLAPQ
ncbi:MAG: hypothetical protein GYA21_00680 [Myxococcales bacterium]|nr:hypothetical protein [Myxococcales bacterium]